MDAELIETLAQRFKMVDEIGKFKHENNITIFQLKRWSNIIQDRLENGENHGINKEFLLKILQLVHKESISRQTHIYTDENIES